MGSRTCRWTNGPTPDSRLPNEEANLFLATVVGSVVSTHKNERLEGKKLLLVRKLSLAMQPEGVETIALDVVDAGVGDHVLVVQEGSSARKIFGDDWLPVQAVIVGVLDRVDINGRQVL